MDTSTLPIPVGESATNPPFKADIGKCYYSGNNLYKLVKATVAIAAASQGKQLESALGTSGPTWLVTLNATAANYAVCGAIPSTHTAAIVASAYFLALVDGVDELAQTGTAASAITTGSILVAGTASDLVRATTAVALPGDIDQHGVLSCGFSLELNTGTAILPYFTRYRAPLR